jgi:thiol-disulfide isomerase/thioredoxin
MTRIGIMTRKLTLFCSLCLFLASTVGPAFAADEPEPPQETAIDLSAHVGKVVYLDFWASWCVPCKKSFPWMMDLVQRHADDGLVILTVNVDADHQAADAFIEQMKSTLPVIYDPKGKLAKAYDLEVMPSSFVYGRDGTLRSSHLGFRVEDAEKLEAELLKLLSEKVESNEGIHEKGH